MASKWVEPETEVEVFARYAGSESCRDCHTNAYRAWADSNHGLAERLPSDALDRAAFEPGRSFRHGTQETTVGLSNGVFTIASLGAGGRQEARAVARVIGHHPLRQYLVEEPGGRWQTLEASWDPRTNEWFNVYGSEDRRPGEWGHWSGRGMNWNSMCGTCHNTRFRKNYDPDTDEYRSSMTERTVGCESCHGPMRDHVGWQRAWQGKKGDPTLRKPTAPQHMERCAPCHARRSEITGDFPPGDSFWDHYLLAIVDESEVYYPDGQVREEDYEFAAFLGSRMHAAGVTCLDCHDPHAARPKLAGNDLCLRCHNGSRTGSPIIDPVKHGFHKPDSTGSLCVNCHMPQTPYMQRHWRHDHGFTTPDPVLTLEFGIPNACNRCHADKDASWARKACDDWYGPKMDRPARHRTRLLAAARRGDATTVPGLLTLLGSPEPPYWKAAAIALADRWGERADVRDALLAQLQHDHPLVRYRAVQALAPRAEAAEAVVVGALRSRLEDPSRAVRFSAAWALRREVTADSTAGRELRQSLRLNADQPTGQAQLAVFELARANLDAAVRHYSKAVAWDPGSPGIRQDYAVALSSAGRAREALDQIAEAVRLEPRIGENHYRLGLAWAELGDLSKAAAALEEAVRLEPRHDRALYNLGLAYHALGRVDDALVQLERAGQVRTDDPRIPFARATVLAQAGRTAEARAAAEESVRRQSGYPPATELLRALAR